jgi:uncharacterized SAM-binding protein YcdF (DUF218 family)
VSRLLRLLRRLSIMLAGVLILALLLYLFRRPILTRVGAFLVVSDPPAAADLIYVLGGGLDTRPLKAAQLYRSGYARRIVVPASETGTAERLGIRPNNALESARLLQRLGVPDSAIVLLRQPGGSTSTLDDARILAVYLKRHQFRRVIAVTSEFHTRRSRWALRKILGDLPVELRMAAADDPRYDVDDWWTREAGMIDCITEYIKFIHNFTQS